MPDLTVREEKLSSEITAELASAAIPDGWADWMIGELEADKSNDAAHAAEVEQAIRKDIHTIDTQLDRLIVGYLDNLFGADEYRGRKNKLIAAKQELREKLATLAKNRASRFEPAIQFILELKRVKIVASQGNAEEKREFLKKVGSNLEIVTPTLRFVPRHAWQLVVDSGRLAHQTLAPSHDGATVAGKSGINSLKAERGRFELPLPLRADRFSKPAHSTTLPPLRRRPKYSGDEMDGQNRAAAGRACGNETIKDPFDGNAP